MAGLAELLQQIADASGLAWNDETYDLASARALSFDERDTYVARLMATASEGDPHAILTLGHLEAREAVPMLLAASQTERPWAPTARRALVLLGHGAEVLDGIIDTALHAPSKMARVAAVMDLPTIGGAKAIAAIEQALGDEDSAVRLLAWDGLVAVFGLGRAIRNADGVLEKSSRLTFLQDHLCCDLVSLRRIGIDELRTISRQLGQGASATTLGLLPTPNPDPAIWDEIRVAMFDGEVGYPVGRMARLAGPWRRWAEACLAMRLDQARPDLRAAGALAQLGATWALPVLREVGNALDDERLTDAIAMLEGAVGMTS